jgi:CRISPR-associated protein Csx10
MKITIKTLSPLMSASGESSALIDADVKFDKYGFPYIQAKTFKGLLRESATEVCEILGMETMIINYLFGAPGANKQGLLQFNSLFIKGHGEIGNELKSATNLNNSFVKKYFTELRQQTTIKNGIAKDKSLRKYRLIKEGVSFETEIEMIPSEYEDFIKKALINLRYIGTRRNRGFGKIMITQNEIIENNDLLSNDETQQLKDQEGKFRLSFTINTLNNLIVSKVIGEQNTVSTEKYITAQMIRGLVAGLIIQDESLLNENAHNDKQFRSVILNGAVKFNHAFFEDTIPIPKVYGFEKTINDSKAEFVFESKKPLKTMSGYGSINENAILTKNVETSFSFHSTRFNNRVAGRSTKEDGAIFYYEGISSNQHFTGKIEGEIKDLLYIQTLLQQNNGIHRMGRSKTAQYAKVRFEDIKIEAITETKGNDSLAYIVFVSPVITYNVFGVAVPDLDVIKTELESYNIKILEILIMSSLRMNEGYMGTWQSKMPREASFDIGTTIKIKFDGILKKELLEFHGVGEKTNEGFGRVVVLSLENSLNRISIGPKSQDNEETKQTINEFSSHSLINEILEKQRAYEFSNKVQIEAINFSSSYANKIPNSLISKLKDVLKTCSSQEDWDQFMINIKGKKAERTLDDANLLSWVKTLKIPDSAKVDNPDFETKKSFWISFFKALRVKSKKN